MSKEEKILMICVDNSEWTLEDSNRFLFQVEAIYQFHKAKPEHSIGVSTIAGEDFEPLIGRLTTQYYNEYITKLAMPSWKDHSNLLSCLYGPDFKIASHINLNYTFRVAIECCNYDDDYYTPSNNPLRIVVFAGGLVIDDKEDLELIGLELKNKNIALDVFNFGEEEDAERKRKLDSLVAAVNSNGNSRIMHVPSPSDYLSSVLSYLNISALRDLMEETQKQKARMVLAEYQLMKLRVKRKKLLEHKRITTRMYAMTICRHPKESLELRCQICCKKGQEAYCCRSCFASNDSISRGDGNNQNRGGCARGGFSARNGGNLHDGSGGGRSHARSERSSSSKYGSFSGSKSRSSYNHPDMPTHSRGQIERGAAKGGLRWVY